MSVASDHVTFFRTARADRYVDTITVTDRTARGAWNRTTKQHAADTTSTAYTGGALIRPASASTKHRGMEGEVIYKYVLHLPYTASGITVGNTVTVDASVYDADLVGAVLTVGAVEDDSYDTHRELFCNLSLGGGDLG